MLRKMFRNKKGQGLVEYGLIIAGVALVAAAAISVFGHKTSDLIAAVAAVLPGASMDDNAPIASGQLIETVSAGDDGPITVDLAGIAAHSGDPRLGENLMGSNVDDFGGLVVCVPH